MTSALNTLPQFSQGIETNSLEISAWTTSSTLISTKGYWQNGSRQGTDWHNHLSSPDDIASIGLATAEGDLDREKIRALLNISYQRMKQLLKTENDFMIDFTEFPVVDTSKSFVKGGSPAKAEDFSPPTTSRYEDANSTIHYGAIQIAGDERFFLVTSHGTYDTVYTSENWNFSDSDPVDTSESVPLEFGRREYLLRPISAGISTSGGEVVALERELGVIGRRPTGAVEEIVNVRRFSNIDEHPVRIDFEVWTG